MLPFGKLKVRTLCVSHSRPFSPAFKCACDSLPFFYLCLNVRTRGHDVFQHHPYRSVHRKQDTALLSYSWMWFTWRHNHTSDPLSHHSDPLSLCTITIFHYMSTYFVHHIPHFLFPDKQHAIKLNLVLMRQLNALLSVQSSELCDFFLSLITIISNDLYLQPNKWLKC